jgi:hypothetical protein
VVVVGSFERSGDPAARDGVSPGDGGQLLLYLFIIYILTEVLSLIIRHAGTPYREEPFEIVERKGPGHPDSLCDGISDAISRGLSRYYLDHFGTILHHNVDKVLLIGGRSKPAFGGGEIVGR